MMGSSKNYFVFDLDGTLLDSMTTWPRAMIRIMDEAGLEYPDDVVNIMTPIGFNGCADYFISLHANAATVAAASGSEGFAFSRPSAAFSLGESILREMTTITGLRNRGMFVRTGLYVLRKTTMPAILLELGFITNPGDAFLMRDNPGLFAEGIYRGIVDYLG